MAKGFEFRTETDAQGWGNHKHLARELTDFINESPTINTTENLADLLHGISAIVKSHNAYLPSTGKQFTKEIRPIDEKWEITFPVVWGGVSFKHVDEPKKYINKLLVVRQRGKLGIEHHERKDEMLRVTEGLFLVMAAAENNPKRLMITFAQPGDTFILKPGKVHGVYAVTDGVIEETSTNTRGEPEDLIFDLGPVADMD